MTWVRMDDQYPDHPKVEAAGPLAAWLNVCGWAYASRFLTDGFIASARVSRLADVSDSLALAKRLVEVELWERVEGGYRIHDYLKYNPTAEQVLKDREAARERMQNVRSSRAIGSPEVRANVRPNTNGSSSSPSRPVPLTSQETKSRESVRPREEVTEDFKQKLEDEFCEQLGSRETVRAHIDAALAHTSRLKYTDDRAYLRRWLRDDATRATTGPPGRNGRPEPVRHIKDNTGLRRQA